MTGVRGLSARTPPPRPRPPHGWSRPARRPRGLGAKGSAESVEGLTAWGTLDPGPRRGLRTRAGRERPTRGSCAVPTRHRLGSGKKGSSRDTDPSPLRPRRPPEYDFFMVPPRPPLPGKWRRGPGARAPGSLIPGPESAGWGGRRGGPVPPPAPPPPVEVRARPRPALHLARPCGPGSAPLRSTSEGGDASWPAPACAAHPLPPPASAKGWARGVAAPSLSRVRARGPR